MDILLKIYKKIHKIGLSTRVKRKTLRRKQDKCALEGVCGF